jgi:hypothetical protein
MTLDPAKVRKHLLEFSIEDERECEFSKAFNLNALSGYGSEMFTTALECLLVGFVAEGRELLLKSLSFVRGAVEHKQRWDKSQGGEQFNQLTDFALCSWMNHKRHEAQRLK